jgi:hypothetical protein
MAWTILDTKPAGNVTDLELLKRMTYALLENGDADATGTSLMTTQFSISEMLDNANLIQQRFLRDCAPVMLRATQGSVPGQNRYSLPADHIHTRRMTWQAQPAGSKAKSLISTDSYQLDRGTSDWEQNSAAQPRYFNEGSNLPTLEFDLARAPSQAGTIGLAYVPQPPTLTGAGVALMVPDEAESAILYGTMGELLSSEGEGIDPERADYCEKRYALCVEMVNALILGADDNTGAQANG